MNPPTCQPFRVQIFLGTPLVLSDAPLNLDAVLAAARVLEAVKQGDKNPFSAQEDLPLEKHSANGQWVWKASRLIGERTESPETQTKVRRYNLVGIALQKDKAWGGKPPGEISEGSGHFKAYLLNYATAWVPKVTAFAVGDPKETERLLNTLSHLGKDRKNGFGKITKVIIEPDDEALTQWVQRSLPLGSDRASNHVLAHGALRPPYWDKAQWTQVLEPLIR